MHEHYDPEPDRRWACAAEDCRLPDVAPITSLPIGVEMLTPDIGMESLPPDHVPCLITIAGEIKKRETAEAEVARLRAALESAALSADTLGATVNLMARTLAIELRKEV